MKARRNWQRVLPSWQMQNIMRTAVGRQLRSTPGGGLRVLSRVGIVSQAPKYVDLDLSSTDLAEMF